MEDAHVAVDDLSQAIGDVAVAHPRAFYGIFDGHGGDAAAQFARQKLLGHVVRDAAFPLHVGSALRNAFLRTDRELETARTPEGYAMESGTTALAVLLLGRSLYVANAGDCRAVLCRRGQAVELSRDHRAACQHERARVERAGGWVVDDYLNDQLAVTRALGDWHLEGLKTRRSSAAAAADADASGAATTAATAACYRCCYRLLLQMLLQAVRLRVVVMLGVVVTVMRLPVEPVARRVQSLLQRGRRCPPYAPGQ
ncbi:hypothetical protein CLOM_g15300 [Closterium sp. NIES-68]|nr:hypothetical protein CLOM_g15300 [Closterium sp. NIES-68]